MNKPYNVDDILNEIKAKKARSARPARPAPARPAENPAPARPETSTATAPRPAEPAPQPEAQQQQPPRQPRPSEQPQPKQQQRPDPMDSTGVFFSSLSNHRETVREEQERLEKERQERERLEAQRREQQRLEQQRKEAELREQQRQEQERARLQQEELTDSFFLEQQPADLPPKEAATPFGDIEPTTPPPEQPDPDLQDKTEYQKYFSSLGRKKKNAPKPEKQPEPQPEQSITFDTSSFETGSEEPEEDLFASTPTGLTEEFGTGGIFSGQQQAKEPAASAKKDGKAFHINLPKDLDEDGEQPQQENEPTREDKKSNLFRRKGTQQAKEEPHSSRLASAEIPVPEEFPEESEEIEDYSSPKDKEAILHDMRSIKSGLLIRIAAMIVLFALSLYLSLAARDIQIGGELLPLPTFIQPELHLRSYMVCLCVVSAIGAVVCANTVGGGLLALLKFRANTDTLPMLALLGTLAQGICFIIKPEYFSTDKADFGSNLYLFFPVALLILLFNLIGKLLVILRIQQNFKLVASEKRKHAAVFLKDRTLLRELSRGLSMEEYTIAYPETSRFLSNFLDNSYSEDHAENMSRVLAPVCLLAGIALSVLSYLFNKNAAEAVSTFTAIMCVSAPLTSTIAANLPLYRLARRLIPAGAMVSGYSAVDAFSRTEAVVLDAKDLFRPSDIILHGIKPFDKSQIDSVILDAASVVCNTDGMLTDVFNKIIGSNRSMLRPVENVTYEDSMGLSAWVDGKRVLVGNRELMVNHGVEVPSNDYEMRYVKDRKNIVYLANSGQLSAMFVISYRPNKQTKEQLDKLSERGMYLIINTSDPNITAEKIHATYDFPMEQIKLMPAKFHAAYENLTAEKDRSPAKIGFIGSSRMMVTAILDCFTARTAIDQAVLIQMIALVAGYALVALFSLMGNLSYLSILHLILFQAVWAIIGTVVPNLKRY
ncbi:MAG TPA: hypothetical protein H9999_05200 [Candidatus Negativibacillus faecipullorum]|nr:hypothetical protein [Candidatus Negativibacillus faecipullorum]